MRTIRPAITLLTPLLIVLLLAACAGSSGAAPSTGVQPVGQPIGEGDLSGGAPGASAAPAAPTDGSGGGDAVGAPIDHARIIRTGTIDLEVRDVTSSVTAARDGIRALGGYVGGSSTRTDGDTPVASVTYRIPVERWEDALDLLRTVGGEGTKVVTEQTEAVEVTGQVIDLEARIRNLRASETALQAIAAQATRIPDVLEVHAQLTQVRGEIEVLSGQLAALEDRAALATLTASFRMPVVAVEVAQQEWDPRVVVDEASASLITVLQGLTTAGIWFAIVWLPILLFVGLVAGVVALAVRRMRRTDATPPTPPATPPPATPPAGETAAA